MNAPGMISIPLDEYNALLDDSEMLAALEGAGVDNWSGYDDAMEIYDQAQEEGEIE